MKKTLLAVGMLFPFAMWGQAIDIKPGLWENTVTVEISGMPAMPAIPQETLDKMTPDQRTQMENMMKGRGGGMPRESTHKSCLTAENLKHSLYDNADKTCTHKLVSASSSVQKIHVECSPSGMTTVGDLTMDRIDSEHIKGNMVAKSTGGQAGRSMETKMTISGKWLSSDCGDVKPFEPKK